MTRIIIDKIWHLEKRSQDFFLFHKYCPTVFRFSGKLFNTYCHNCREYVPKEVINKVKFITGAE